MQTKLNGTEMSANKIRQWKYRENCLIHIWSKTEEKKVIGEDLIH